MKYIIPALLTLSVLLFSCNNNNNNTLSKYLNQGHLATQSFSIDINRDTMLLTKAGVVIKIPKGSLQSDNPNVKLDVKEALSNEDIVLAGLTTMSGKQALSSGGMLYINPAEGYKATIVKPLETMVPTKDYDAGMKVFKGVDSAGKLDWQAPELLPVDTTQKLILAGKELFQANCSNCHKPNEDFTGPALNEAARRNSKQWIYHFIKSPADANDREATRIKRIWTPTVMTAFPVLGHDAIDAILAYCSTVSPTTKPAYRYPGIVTGENYMCADSCRKYWNAMHGIQEERSDLQYNNDEFFNLNREYPLDTATVIDEPVIDTLPVVIDTKERVIPNRPMATFYTVNINTFGWCNIDRLMGDDCTPSRLVVNMKTQEKADFTVLLLVPSVKAMIEGGLLANNEQYGFDDLNGAIPLPQGQQCYVIAFAEAGDKLIFAKKEFYAAKDQEINLEFSETTKEGLKKEIESLHLDGVSAEVKDAKNADKIKVLDKKAAEAEKLRPKNCDCGMSEPEPMPAGSLSVQLAKK